MTTPETAMVVHDGPSPAALTVFGTDDPAGIVAAVEAKAQALGAFIRAHGMARRLESARAAARREARGDPPPREYVMIDGWSFLGQMLGVASVTREVREVRSPEGDLLGFEARVELVRVRDGAIVGGATGECSWAEARWEGREPFAVKSMAQTRATGKAFRLNYGFVMAAAGFEATPAEEMTLDDEDAPRGPQEARQRSQPRGRQSTTTAPHQHVPAAPRALGELLNRALREHGLSRPQLLEILGIDDPTLRTLAPAEIERAWAQILTKVAPQPPAAEPLSDEPAAPAAEDGEFTDAGPANAATEPAEA